MSTNLAPQALRFARLFTLEYARRVNKQLVAPASSVVVKPNELHSALSRPLNTSYYEPHRPVQYLAATLAWGIINGHPFMDGNKRTGFFLGNAYLRAHGLPGWVDNCDMDQHILAIADCFVHAADGKLDVEGLSKVYVQ